MKCALSVLLARALLLMSLVRGLHGVTVLGKVLQSKGVLSMLATADSVSKETWSKILSKMRSTARTLGFKDADLNHAEGLNAGLSGVKPVVLLAHHKGSGEAFHNASLSWSQIIDKCLGKGYVLSSKDVLAMRDAAAEVFLAKHANGIKRASSYTRMSLGRSMAMTLPLLFNRPAGEYDQHLHDAMKSGQADDPFSLFHIDSWTEFVSMWKKLRQVACFVGIASKSVHHCASDGQLKRSFTPWQCVLVHLCEVRQCLKKFGKKTLQGLLYNVQNMTEEQTKDARKAHSELFQKGYAGGSDCHAVYQTKCVARIINYDLQRLATTEVDMAGSKKEMHAILIAMAKHKLSPKVVTVCIPEWVALRSSMEVLLPKTKELCGGVQDVMVLRKAARELGNRDSEVRLASRDKLVAIIAAGKVQKPRPLSLARLRKLVREAGEQPQPDKYTVGGNWTSIQCRAFLLKRKKSSELRSLLPENMKKARLCKDEMVSIMLEDKHGSF